MSRINPLPLTTEERTARKGEKSIRSTIEQTIDQIFNKQTSITYSYDNFPNFYTTSIPKIIEQFAELGYVVTDNTRNKTLTINWDNGK